MGRPKKRMNQNVANLKKMLWDAAKEAYFEMKSATGEAKIKYIHALTQAGACWSKLHFDHETEQRIAEMEREAEKKTLTLPDYTVKAVDQ